MNCSALDIAVQVDMRFMINFSLMLLAFGVCHLTCSSDGFSIPGKSSDSCEIPATSHDFDRMDMNTAYFRMFLRYCNVAGLFGECAPQRRETQQL